jgi:16S rRNA (guanine527-N7)-methyltransferase
MFHVKHEAWGPWGELLGFPIGARMAQLLERYEQLLLEKALPLGMIGRADRGQLRERHIVDSLRAATLLGPGPGRVVDLGSGAGLPGIPLSIARPDMTFCLADLRKRRVAFMELAVDSLGLNNAIVFAGKVEHLAGRFDACLSRAFADVDRAWAIAEPRLSPSGKLLFWAGRSVDVGAGAPAGARMSVSAAAGLADAGPIVIMSRQ